MRKNSAPSTRNPNGFYINIINMICDDPMVHQSLKHGRSPVRYPAHYVQSYNLQIPANIGILLISGMPGRPCDKVPHTSATRRQSPSLESVGRWPTTKSCSLTAHVPVAIFLQTWNWLGSSSMYFLLRFKVPSSEMIYLFARMEISQCMWRIYNPILEPPRLNHFSVSF